MIRHIVLFKLRDFDDKAGRLREIKAEMEKLPGAIPELLEIRVGLNVNPAERWDLSLEAVVAGLGELEVYAGHPAHQEIVRRLIAPVREDRACVDFEI